MVIKVNTSTSPENFQSVVFLRYRIAITNLRKVKAPGYHTDLNDGEICRFNGPFSTYFQVIVSDLSAEELSRYNHSLKVKQWRESIKKDG